MSRSDRSAAEVFLPQHSKPGFGENGLPEVIVLDTEREGGMALGLGKKRVDEMDISLCFEERAKAVGHLLGTVAQRHDAPHNVTHLTALTIAFSNNIEGTT